MTIRSDIRNIAIIAHVDHGKTTLVDELLKQSGTFRENEQVNERAMDNNDIEKERGITILAKNTAVDYEGVRVNILDTPGHADFGGEVERILKMVDGVLLVVDAFEGCMPQTRFVLKKALEQKLTPVLVVNKIDRPMARPEEVVDEVLDLFIELGADEEQLEFPVVYASAINGTASADSDPTKQDDNMRVLFNTVIETVPAPIDNSQEPFQFQVTMLDYNDYLGRIGVGRVFRGTIRKGDQASLVKRDGSIKTFRISKLFGFLGLKRLEIDEAKAGDLIAIAGIEDIMVGETICPSDNPDPMELVRIDEPTLQMTFLVNNSPFAGREGDHVTSRKIEARLLTQVETDVSLRVENTSSPDIWTVSGRGELHLSILIENLRREGYELQVSKPEVIIREVDGKPCEPFENAQVDVPEEYTGAVMESLGERKAELLNMVNKGDGQVRMDFLVPSRGLIGYTTEFMAQTKGYGILNHTFDSYQPVAQGYVGGRRQGVLVSMENGKATPYGMLQVEDRGILFVEAGTEIYEGMIVGEHNRDNDLTVNITKMKQQTNIRSATKEQTVTMKKPRLLTLEEALEFLNEDEYCEVTPHSIRLRKKILDKSMREREEKRKKLSAKNN
ncbi:translational GTPase TypA [Salipaludibacillus agaradhaerens]|jgi:GTP-binding protein|uniref:Large ribosomal subunit assembly factor BipA n=1 Tax=Salipaludibacillus agaradhaerens TaxID=76935 RepID=A0A9Q4B0Y9_SALAG|nr:translational GTPase TypA [Salipaludibacillus agaradhaerens]MCR6096351.1 translational GTPase TypA [Salipaludibacillus agaradhaerens]MCR6110820.1 translational GTPase TypA [Bacillus sp. A301a_S52]MCR6114090.1 translational GTPase TypA [Salipaludibacillus agaradhaerens]